jgi:hypothetical protein
MLRAQMDKLFQVSYFHFGAKPLFPRDQGIDLGQGFNRQIFLVVIVTKANNPELISYVLLLEFLPGREHTHSTTPMIYHSRQRIYHRWYL